MTDSTVLAFRQPGEIADPLTEILRQGARELLAQAIEAEVCAHLEAHIHLKDRPGPPADRTPWSWPRAGDPHRDRAGAGPARQDPRPGRRWR